MMLKWLKFVYAPKFNFRGYIIVDHSTKKGDIMDENIKVEKWTLEDGRRAERRVTIQKDENGQDEKIVELFVEDERPLRLQQRVVEKTKPVIFERKIETVDPISGNVIEQKIESLEPKVPLQLVDHIRVAQAPAMGISAQSVENEGDRPVTKQEMIDAIVAAIKANREVVHSAPMAPAAPVKVEKPAKKINSLGIAEELEKAAAEPAKAGMSKTDKILLVVIAAQVIGLGYILFFM